MPILSESQHFGIIQRIADNRACCIPSDTLATLSFSIIEKILELYLASTYFDFILSHNFDCLPAINISCLQGEIISGVGNSKMVVRRSDNIQP